MINQCCYKHFLLGKYTFDYAETTLKAMHDDKNFKKFKKGTVTHMKENAHLTQIQNGRRNIFSVFFLVLSGEN